MEKTRGVVCPWPAFFLLLFICNGPTIPSLAIRPNLSSSCFMSIGNRADVLWRVLLSRESTWHGKTGRRFHLCLLHRPPLGELLFRGHGLHGRQGRLGGRLLDRGGRIASGCREGKDNRRLPVRSGLFRSFDVPRAFLRERRSRRTCPRGHRAGTIARAFRRKVPPAIPWGTR